MEKLSLMEPKEVPEFCLQLSNSFEIWQEKEATDVSDIESK